MYSRPDALGRELGMGFKRLISSSKGFNSNAILSLSNLAAANFLPWESLGKSMKIFFLHKCLSIFLSAIISSIPSFVFMLAVSVQLTKRLRS